MTRAIAWGALWALAGGFWLLAPLIVRTHHLSVERPLQAFPVIAMLCLLFVFLGAFLGVLIHLGVVATRRIARRPGSLSPWGTAFVTGVLLAPAYVIAGCLIYVKRFGMDGAVAWSASALYAALPAILVTAAILIGIQIVTTGRMRSYRTRLAAGIATISFLVAATALLLRLPEVTGRSISAHELDVVPGGPAGRTPLLLVGIDGAAWRPIEPLLAAGRLPTMSSLIKGGSYGDLEALWPPYWSSTAWSAIVTGLPREEVGVYGNLVVKAPGLPAFQAPLDIDPRLILVTAIQYGLAFGQLIKAAPPERSALKRPPVWEMLHKSGVKTAVVRFNFTYPAGGQADIVVSNRVVPDVWDLLGVKNADPAGLAAPDSLRDELMIPFMPGWTPPTDEVARVFPQGEWTQPEDSHVHPVPLLKRVLSYDQQTVHAVTRILRAHPDIEVLIVHFGGLDNVQHIFWQYRFPGDFVKKPTPADVEVLGPVIDRYLEFLDRGIGEMMAAFPSRPNVMIVSDHGMESLEGVPPWKAYHGTPGIFVAAGPGMPVVAAKRKVSYFDITPTVLSLEGLVKPGGLKGKDLSEAVPH
ncbi:MAG: alkaline phosphatase family protein [Gemmatimonadaceae bacterium]